MKKSLLATAAAIALLAGPAVAQKQDAPASKAEAPARAPAAQQNAPAEKMAPDAKANTKSGASADVKADKNGAKAGAKSETTAQGGAQQQPRSAQPSDQKSGAQSGQANQASRAGDTNVNLTAEQKTKIRTTIIQSKSAPKVANVNFSLNVGTVVPRTVNIVAVPPTLVEVYPTWRGYRYFVVGERVVIVEPNSLKIVAILVV